MGGLADIKITFTSDLTSLDEASFISTDVVTKHLKLLDYSDVESLAIQSGKYSRFSMDPNISQKQFVNLYKAWIRKSLNPNDADEVLVIRGGDRIVGMATLTDQNSRGTIGLIAVDREFRGNGLGEKLVRAAQINFISKGYEISQVVTQKMNYPACTLYRKCDYLVEKEEYFYHFWL